MAASQPLVGGLPQSGTEPRRSFADVLAAPSQAATPLLANTPPVSVEDALPGSHKGFPAMEFIDHHIHALSEPFTWSIIGKFSQGFNKRDPNKYFRTLDFKASFQIGLLDNRHLLITLFSEDDYLRLYSRTVWHIGNVTMRVFKWTPFFNVDRESSMVPVWITMPRLPVLFFAKPALFKIASLLGTPLRLDAATQSLKRPGVARIQIEIDLLKERHNPIFIGMGSADGFWQKVEYENLPNYCTHCWHVGHSESMCHVHNPELRPKRAENPPSTNVRQEYRPKQVAVITPEAPSGDNPQPPPTGSGPPLTTHSPSAPPVLHLTQPPNFSNAPLDPPLVAQEIGFPPVSVEHVSQEEDMVVTLSAEVPQEPPYEYPFLLTTVIRDDLHVSRPSSLLRQQLDTTSRADAFRSLREFHASFVSGPPPELPLVLQEVEVQPASVDDSQWETVAKRRRGRPPKNPTAAPKTPAARVPKAQHRTSTSSPPVFK